MDHALAVCDSHYGECSAKVKTKRAATANAYVILGIHTKRKNTRGVFFFFALAGRINSDYD